MILPLSPYSGALRYYHATVNRTFRFLVPAGKTILYYGPYLPGLIPELDSQFIVVVSQTNLEGELSVVSGSRTTVVSSKYEEYLPDGTFDYVILNGALGESDDICSLLSRVRSACHAGTRVIIYQHNYLWQGMITLAERLRIISKGSIQNWVSVRDLASFLDGMGFKALRIFRQTLSPLKLGLLGAFINWLTVLIPLLDFFKLNQYIIARPNFYDVKEVNPKSLSLVLTVRDECGNIEPIIKSLPRVCADQEILFVEGHSSDGTKEEIERVIRLYPEKRIRLLIQPGKGQGDAIRVGFKAALGDIIILYEGDGTSSPDDISYFYEALSSGRFEFVEGSRFIYPFDDRSMTFFKKLGNIFFARWFSWFLGQHTTDVLSGIKAITRKEYETIYEHWGFLGLEDPFGDFELLYGAFRFGLRCGEIPMHYRPRPYGVSKSSLFRHGTYLLRMAGRGYWIFRSADIRKRLKCEGVNAA